MQKAFLAGPLALLIVALGAVLPPVTHMEAKDLIARPAAPAEAQPAPESEEDRLQRESKRALLELAAALRTHRLRHDAYPSALRGLVDRGILPEIPKDSWGGDFAYELKTDNGEGDGPRRGGRRSDDDAPKKTGEMRSYFELRSAGPDKAFGTTDDLRYTKDGLRLTLSNAQRDRILAEGGANYAQSRQGWAWEQTYRLWLAVAEAEYDTGKPVDSIATLVLPRFVFPNGEPVDVFGRRLELRNVRGLRAIVAPEIKEVAAALSLSEAEFVNNLMGRLAPSDNRDWYTQRVVEEIVSFYGTHGRLPLTMSELIRNTSNRWFNRDRFGNGFHYVTLNDDLSFVLISLGADQIPGGLNQNRDAVTYGPDNVSTLAATRAGSQAWMNGGDNTPVKLYENLRKAIQKRFDTEKGEGPGGEESGKFGPIPEGLPDDLRKRIEEALRKAQQEKEDNEKEEKKEVKEEGDAKPEPAPQPAGGAAVPPPVLPEGSEKDEGSRSRSTRNACSSSATAAGAFRDVDRSALLAQAGNSAPPRPPVPAPAPVPVPAPAAPAAPPAPAPAPVPAEGAADDDATPDPVVEPVPPAYVMKGPGDLVPLKLFPANEARDVGIAATDDYRFQYPVDNLFNEATAYKDRAGPDEPFPCGNVALSKAENFRNASNKSWLEDWGWHEDGGNTFKAFIITRMVRGEFNSLKSLVCVGVPESKADPIVVFALIDGEKTGPLYARLDDQAQGWFEQAIAYDGTPAASGKKPDDKPGEAKPAEQPPKRD